VFEYSTKLALGGYWEQLQPMDKKVFERDIKTTLIEQYISSLVNLEDWNHVTITVDNNFSQLNNLAEVEVFSSLENKNINATVTLKMIRKDRWRIYDLVYQSFSILDYFEYSYNEKIRRAGGLKNTLQNMLQRT
jgi:phospholipid transport system substrate-binding protein